jgi:NADPH-dependent glutamate synthase beta subunit-like oxidoreductase
VEAALREGIGLLEGAKPVEVVARDGRTVGLRIERAADDAATREVLPAETILVAIGEEPDPSILPAGTGIEISAWAGIVADPRTLQTGQAGVFAGGDVVSGPKTIIDAVASGRRAAGRIHEYLAGASDGEREILAAVRYATARERSLNLDLAPAARPIQRHGEVIALDQPTHLGLDEQVARAEAERCFRCDAIYACPTVKVRAGRGPDHTELQRIGGTA